MDTTNTSEPWVETHFFKFNSNALINPLERFSNAEFNQGEEAVLVGKQYTRLPGGPDHIETYTSTWASDAYLLIMRTPPYRFIFYIPDDASLLEWQRTYQHMSASFLAQTFLPPPKTVPEMITIPMNMKVLRGR